MLHGGCGIKAETDSAEKERVGVVNGADLLLMASKIYIINSSNERQKRV